MSDRDSKEGQRSSSFNLKKTGLDRLEGNENEEVRCNSEKRQILGFRRGTTNSGRTISKGS